MSSGERFMKAKETGITIIHIDAPKKTQAHLQPMEEIRP
jgi:hypothetical protein